MKIFSKMDSQTMQNLEISLHVKKFHIQLIFQDFNSNLTTYRKIYIMVEQLTTDM